MQCKGIRETTCKTLPRAGKLFFSSSLKFGEKIANRYRNNTVPPFGPYSLGSPIMAPSNTTFLAFFKGESTRKSATYSPQSFLELFFDFRNNDAIFKSEFQTGKKLVSEFSEPVAGQNREWKKRKERPRKHGLRYFNQK